MAQDANDRFIFDQATGWLWFDRDGTCEQAQDLVVVLDNRTRSAASDIPLSRAGGDRLSPLA